ncbi:ABC transporter substrate-binding protein [Colwellia sp. 12G3]|uniref:ABC transporter substrate-binding protein n=1 Tax=Colwellia sp. 12G3 TaxID=2058299 RepID=UPI000C32224A|nr:ABC transporter substrate-binding protein [Colwellia sp. 12G3]PKI16796.1 glycine/betaine ABC transporter substrate-binding protein [Colwellia sp. 12G3]
MKNSILCLVILLFSNVVVAQQIVTPLEPIKIILNNWTSQLTVARIAGSLFQRQGFAVKYIRLPTAGQWYMLKHNRADVQVEVWQGTMAEKYDQMLKANWLVDAGTYDAITREEWWYPEYVEEYCPGLPDWRALKSCFSVFSKPGSQGFGVYIGGPWEKPDKARVRALGLKFKITNTTTGNQLWEELESAIKDKLPIVLFNWTPNWVGSIHKGKFVEFPEHSIECETNPQWGINTSFLYDCGNPKAGWLKKVTSTEFPTKWPCPFEILKNMNFSNAQLEYISTLVDVKKMSYQQSADVWLKENQQIWQDWIPKECS